MKKYISIILALILLGSLIGCVGVNIPTNNKFAKCLKSQMVNQLANQNIECPNPTIYYMDHAPPSIRDYTLECKHYKEVSTYGVSNDIIVSCNRQVHGEP